MRTANTFQLWARGLIECGGDDYVIEGLLEEDLVSHIIIMLYMLCVQ